MENINIPHAEKILAHIAACTASGINIRAYCKEHKLTPSNYYYWLAKIKDPLPAGKFISIPLQETNVPVYIDFTSIRVYFENMPPAEYIKKILS